MKKHVQEFGEFSGLAAVQESQSIYAVGSMRAIPFKQFVKKALKASYVSINGSKPAEIDSVLDNVLGDNYGYGGESVEIASRAGIVTAGELENPMVSVTEYGSYIVMDHFEREPVEVEFLSSRYNWD